MSPVAYSTQVLLLSPGSGQMAEHVSDTQHSQPGSRVKHLRHGESCATGASGRSCHCPPAPDSRQQKKGRRLAPDMHSHGGPASHCESPVTTAAKCLGSAKSSTHAGTSAVRSVHHRAGSFPILPDVFETQVHDGPPWLSWLTGVCSLYAQDAAVANPVADW